MSSASAASRLMMDLMLEWKSTMTVSFKMLVLLGLSVHGCHWQTWYSGSFQWATTRCQCFLCAAQWAAHSAGMVTVSWWLHDMAVRTTVSGCAVSPRMCHQARAAEFSWVAWLQSVCALLQTSSLMRGLQHPTSSCWRLLRPGSGASWKLMLEQTLDCPAWPLKPLPFSETGVHML